MCGIAGKVYFQKGGITQKELFALSKKIAHRGPDDNGIYISSNKKVGLVSRRLAIIDLSYAGHQPMSYKGRYWITYNGEIFNFQTERRKLEKEGYKFSSNTDTEVILALYDRYKVKCLDHLRGFFAFALFDQKENTLFMARDRLGKKPLKYFWDKNVFIFASELKALLTQKEVKVKPDWIAIHHFLTYGYIPSPQTGFENIFKLEPAHFILLDLNKKKIIKKRYWKLDFNNKLHLSETEWERKILSSLEESTRLRMISDVPIGALLSGGVDSSAVVANMAMLSQKPVKTFTIVFKEDYYDERVYAKKIADLYKTDHHELEAKADSIEDLPEIIYQYEEPFADSSNLVTYMISKLAKKYVTVILNGDGGDENFAGYVRHWKIKRDLFVDRNKQLKKAMFPMLKTLSKRGLRFAARAERFLTKSRLDLAHRYVTYNVFFTNEDKEKLYSDKFWDLVDGVNSYDVMNAKFSESAATDPCDQAAYSDLNLYLPDDLLTKVDIANMAFSLEGRSPLLDYKFVEMVSQMPYNLKVRGLTQNKYIFKKALGKIVPRENLYRTKKGFSVPLASWFEGDLMSYAKSILLSKKALSRDLFKKESIKYMIGAHTQKNDYAPRLWALLNLELWIRRFLD